MKFEFFLMRHHVHQIAESEICSHLGKLGQSNDCSVHTLSQVRVVLASPYRIVLKFRDVCNRPAVSVKREGLAP